MDGFSWNNPPISRRSSRTGGGWNFELIEPQAIPYILELFTPQAERERRSLPEMLKNLAALSQLRSNIPENVAGELYEKAITVPSKFGLGKGTRSSMFPKYEPSREEAISPQGESEVYMAPPSKKTIPSNIEQLLPPTRLEPTSAQIKEMTQTFVEAGYDEDTAKDMAVHSLAKVTPPKIPEREAQALNASAEALLNLFPDMSKEDREQAKESIILPEFVKFKEAMGKAKTQEAKDKVAEAWKQKVFDALQGYRGKRLAQGEGTKEERKAEKREEREEKKGERAEAKVEKRVDAFFTHLYKAESDFRNLILTNAKTLGTKFKAPPSAEDFWYNEQWSRPFKDEVKALTGVNFDHFPTREEVEQSMGRRKAPPTTRTIPPSPPPTKPPSQADLEFTAKKYNITVKEVKERLGIK